MASLRSRYEHVCQQNGIESAILHQHHVSAAWRHSTNLYRKRTFRSPIATLYKTNGILTICTFSIAIGHQHDARTWRSRAYIREENCRNAQFLFGGIFFWFSQVFYRQWRCNSAVAERLLQTDTIKTMFFCIGKWAWPSDHGKRSVFWFHENDEKCKYA